ncbi:MAG: hypothetical protein HRU15_11980, partial [Planctomycetes bacterium]|nr:hypothetical protein [Planctomycetota bacterium]
MISWFNKRITRKIWLYSTASTIAILAIFFTLAYQLDLSRVNESAFQNIEAIGRTLISQINAEDHEEFVSLNYDSSAAGTNEALHAEYALMVEPLIL